MWLRNSLISSRFLEDGTYELIFPYADDRELIGDILRFGSDVEVLEPYHLRSKIQKILLAAAMRYT